MRYTRTLATLLLCSLLLTGCGGQNETESAETAEPPQTTPETEAVETEMPETDEEMPETEPVLPETPEIPTGEALAKIIRAPGLFLQYLTTREPTDDMLEVAAAAVKAADTDD